MRYEHMKLKYIVPNMAQTFGNLEFAGENDVEQQRVNGRFVPVTRSYNLYSDIQRADDIIVVLPAKAGEKRFKYEQKVKLVNPKITAEGKNVRGRGYTNYILTADDMLPVLDKEKTFGVLKFSALRHEVRVENEDGTTSEEIKRRTYDLKCSQQERTIQVSIPAEIPVKDYPYNAEVELINPVADTVANANYRGADVEWYIKADDIVLKNKGGQPAGNLQNHAPHGQQKK